MSEQENQQEVVQNNVQENRTPKNEIRVKFDGNLRFYVKYAMGLLNPFPYQQQQKFDTVIVKGMRNATVIAIHLAEILKQRVPELYQITEIHSTTVTDKVTDGKTVDKTIPSVTITLSRKPLEKEHIGFQTNDPEREPVTTSPSQRGRGGRGRDRPMRGRGRPMRGRLMRGRGSQMIMMMSPPMEEGQMMQMRGGMPMRGMPMRGGVPMRGGMPMRGRPMRGRGRGRRGRGRRGRGRGRPLPQNIEEHQNEDGPQPVQPRNQG